MLELELGSGSRNRSGSRSSDAATLTTKSISPTVTNAISPDESLGATSDVTQVCNSWHCTKRFRVKFYSLGEVGLGLGYR